MSEIVLPSMEELLKRAETKGRKDADEEHKKMCESCIHKVSAEDVEQIRADAIEQILEQMKAYRDAHYYSFANYDVQKYADGFKNATNTLISMVEQIKEQKNDLC